MPSTQLLVSWTKLLLKLKILKKQNAQTRILDIYVIKSTEYPYRLQSALDRHQRNGSKNTTSKQISHFRTQLASCKLVKRLQRIHFFVWLLYRCDAS